MSFRPFDIAKVSGFEKLNGEQFLRYFLLSFNYPTFCLSFDTAKKTIIGELKREHKKGRCDSPLSVESVDSSFFSLILVSAHVSV
jgi:hypothetical protein